MNIVCSDGFILRELFVHEFSGDLYGNTFKGLSFGIDFVNCLFMVVPTYQSQAQEVIELQMDDMQTRNLPGLIEDQASFEQLLDEFDYDTRQMLEKFEKFINLPISYHHSFQLLHLKTSKYFAVINTESEL
jgi:hypothetical protein